MAEGLVVFDVARTQLDAWARENYSHFSCEADEKARLLLVSAGFDAFGYAVFAESDALAVEHARRLADLALLDAADDAAAELEFEVWRVTDAPDAGGCQTVCATVSG